MKLFFLFLSSAICSVANSQPQRMVILPSSLAGETGAWLCIDPFRGSPSGHNYSTVLYKGQSASTTQIEKIGNGALIKNGKYYEGETELPLGNDAAVIVGTTNEAVPDYYVSFIEQAIKQYEGKHFDLVEKSELQRQIWSYAELDYIGYINRQDNSLQALEKGKTKFFDDFGVGQDYQSEMGIKLIVEKIAKIGEETEGYTLPNLTYVYFNQSANKYLAFQNNKLIYSGKSEELLAQKLGEGKSDETITIAIDNLPPAKQEALLFTLGNFSSGNRILGTDYYSLYDLGRLYNSELMLKNKLTSTTSLVKGYYQKGFTLIDMYSEPVGLEANSSQKNVLLSFISKINTTLFGRNEVPSFGSFCEDFQRDMMKRNLIRNYSEFTIRSKGEFSKMKLVKVKVTKQYVYINGNS